MTSAPGPNRPEPGARADAPLVILGQVDANTSKLLAEAATTRPWARTMAGDFKTMKACLVTTEGAVDPSKSQKAGIAPFCPTNVPRTRPRG